MTRSNTHATVFTERSVHKLLCRSTAVAVFLMLLTQTQNQIEAADQRSDRIQRIYIGTYTGPKSEGIYVAELNSRNGKLSKPRLAAEMVSPSWVTIHPNRQFLYAAGESNTYANGGAICAFKINPNGSLSKVNSVPPHGSGPCHLGIDSTGSSMLISNYGSGNVASVLLNDDGSVSASDWSDQYPVLNGNQKPHAHHACFSINNQFALVCDAGLDRIYTYRHDAKSGKITPNDPAFTPTAPETHPRHLTFSLDGNFCYVINEKAMSVSAFTFDASTGVLEEIQTISSLPDDYEGEVGSTAELILHPSGKFLYGSNRGPDSLVCYAVNPENGKLSLVGHTPTEGKTARSFGIDRTGKWMLIGNQNSDTIVQFKINTRTGELTPTGTEYELGSPVCFQFMPTTLHGRDLR